MIVNCVDNVKPSVVVSESEDEGRSPSYREAYIIQEGFYKLGNKERDKDVSSGINFRLKYEKYLSRLNEERNNIQLEMQQQETSYQTLQESYDEVGRRYHIERTTTGDQLSNATRIL